MTDKKSDSNEFKIVVLLSGTGTTMVNLQESIEKGAVPAKIVAVISSRSKAPGVRRAEEFGIPTKILSRKRFYVHNQFNPAAYSMALAQLVEPFEPDLVVMAGFMTQLAAPFLDKFSTLNVHPALLPSFGGKGFYGHFVHEAVLAAGVKISGATVHFADGQYDKGPIVCQEAVQVMEDDTVESLAKRVQEAERRIYPKAIGLIAKGLVKVTGMRAVVSKE